MLFENQRNPILPLDIHVPDSEAHVMPDGKLYIYGSFDDRNDVYCSDRYHVVSTADMKHWEVHPVSLKGQDVPWFSDPDAPKYPGIDWTHPTPFIRKMMEKEMASGTDMKAAFEEAAKTDKPPLLFAPDCLEKNGKYYLYFCMADDSEGVAVSDRPEGPFTVVRQLPVGGIDPAIFIDNDGQAYYYWGQLFSHGVRLKDDMISIDPSEIQNDLVTEEEHFFHEGSSIRRIGDTYYYVYADMERGKPTSLGYATGKTPLGPFNYQGIIIDNDGCDPESWNNHGSIECVDGQWYVFYHRCSRGDKIYRRLCIEKIEIRPDGTIPEVKMTSQGVGEPFGPGEDIFGYQACGLEGGCFIDVDDKYGEALTSISAGDRAVFRYVRKDSDWEKIRLETAGSGTVRVLLNDHLAGEVRVSAEGQTEAFLQAPEGQAELVLEFSEVSDLKLYKVTLF